ncbi:MAG: glycerol-3-phosphate acyltransferase [Ignavibacteriales bacterium]|nr:glycerol-3-phosphate acyltransferase [Ignavibacteriales bacterium]
MQYILSFLLGYFIGSFPVAYILVKQNAQLDIRKAGSGNIGARNAFDVTGSTLIGASVLIIDLLKGASAVWIGKILFGQEFWIVSIGGVGAVLGHNYSPWMKFKGGRGLSTTAGAMILIGWIYVVIWLLLYFIINKFLKQIHISTLIATIIAPLLITIAPEPLISSLLLTEIDRINLMYLCIIFGLLILIRHYEPIVEIFRTKRNSS